MISESHLERALEVLAALFVVALLFLLISTIIASRKRIAREEAMAASRKWVSRWLNDPKDSSAWEGLLKLSRKHQIAVLEAFHPLLEGESRGRLREFAIKAGIVDFARRRTKSLFWTKRLEAVWLLTLCSTGEDLVPALAGDEVSAVRLQAAEWIGENPSEESIRLLLRMLDDDDRVCRHRVQDVLLRIGHDAVPALIEFLRERPSHPTAWRVVSLLGDSRTLSPAIQNKDSKTAAVRGYIAALLGRLGGADAIAVLRSYLADPDPTVRVRAMEGLQNLNDWQSASAISALLRDSAFACRKQAAFALLSFGSPGMILLNRAKTSDDRFAADMARQILESSAVIGAAR